MSDTNTPISTERAPELYLDIESADAILTPKVSTELGDAFTTPEEKASKIAKADQEEAEAMDSLRATDPEGYIKHLGEKALNRHKANSAKFAQSVESRTYQQVADGVVSREEYQPQEIIPRKKRWPDLLDTNTRLGRAVSIIVFGEKSSKASAYKVPKAQKTSKPIHEMTGGKLSQDYVNKINYPR